MPKTPEIEAAEAEYREARGTLALIRAMERDALRLYTLSLARLAAAWKENLHDPASDAG